MYLDPDAGGRIELNPWQRIARAENPLTVWRQHRGLTTLELAAAVDVPEEVVLVIEAQNVPLVRDARMAIAKALGITPGDLLG